MNQMKKMILFHNNRGFISPHTRQYDIMMFLKAQYPRWVTCREIALKVYGISAKKVYYFFTKSLKSPGGKNAIEVRKNGLFQANTYRYIP